MSARKLRIIHKFMLIYNTPSGNFIHRCEKSIIILFNGKKAVLSTGPLNGGYNEKLNSVFIKDENPGSGMACELRAKTYKSHMELIANELGLDVNATTGLSTAASMENAAIVTKSHGETSVTAIVTGGVEINGLRAGDPASYDETKFKKTINGTINIILDINVSLPKETMVKALIVGTEAKSAAILELMAKSNYSCDIATGSGTDGMIIISNIESNIILSDAGGHSKLGELIGIAVKESVKESLDNQTGLNPKSQHNFIRRFERYGIDENSLWDAYLKLMSENFQFYQTHISKIFSNTFSPMENKLSESAKKNQRFSYNNNDNFIELKSLRKTEFIHFIHCISTDEEIVTQSSLYVHLLDQLRWNLLNEKEVKNACLLILKNLKKYYGVDKNIFKNVTKLEIHSNSNKKNKIILNENNLNLNNTIQHLVEIFKEFVIEIIIYKIFNETK